MQAFGHLISIFHVVDVVLDVLYFYNTPMENPNYRLVLLCCLFLPFIAVFIIAFLMALEYKNGFRGFCIFVFGGVTYSTHNIMFHAEIGNIREQELHEFVLGIIYAIFEDAPQLLYQTMNTIYLGQRMSWIQGLSPIFSVGGITLRPFWFPKERL